MVQVTKNTFSEKRMVDRGLCGWFDDKGDLMVASTPVSCPTTAQMVDNHLLEWFAKFLVPWPGMVLQTSLRHGQWISRGSSPPPSDCMGVIVTQRDDDHLYMHRDEASHWLDPRRSATDRCNLMALRSLERGSAPVVSGPFPIRSDSASVSIEFSYTRNELNQWMRGLQRGWEVMNTKGNVYTLLYGSDKTPLPIELPRHMTALEQYVCALAYFRFQVSSSGSYRVEMSGGERASRRGPDSFVLSNHLNGCGYVVRGLPQHIKPSIAVFALRLGPGEAFLMGTELVAIWSRRIRAPLNDILPQDIVSLVLTFLVDDPVVDEYDAYCMAHARPYFDPFEHRWGTKRFKALPDEIAFVCKSRV